MFIGVEIGFMVRYTIENDSYNGARISYSSCEAPKLTSTTLNTNVITWDRLVTKTRHTTSRDTIPGTTSTTRVDTTQTYKCEILVTTSTTIANKDEYLSFYIARTTASYTPPNYIATDGYKNRQYTDSYTVLVSDPIVNGRVEVSIQNGYANRSTGSTSNSSSWSWQTTCIGVSYSTWIAYSRYLVPIGNGIYSTAEIPYPGGKYVNYVANTTLSSSSSTSGSWRETNPVHYLGSTASVSMPISSSQTRTLAFTTAEEGTPNKMNIIVNNRRINEAYLSYKNYNVQSSLFYLGTVNVNITTKITSERVVR